MDRRTVARFAAPAAFLAGVTIAVLIVRAGTADDTPATTAAAATTQVTTRAKPKPKTKTKPKPKAAAAYARVEAGDTLDQIALEHDTTVERILQLNDRLDPNGLQIGQRIRVK